MPFITEGIDHSPARTVDQLLVGDLVGLDVVLPDQAVRVAEDAVFVELLKLRAALRARRIELDQIAIDPHSRTNGDQEH